MPKVLINGEDRDVAGEINLKELLDQLSLPAQRIAIELNREVVPRKMWADRLVNDGDRIEIVHFVGGG